MAGNKNDGLGYTPGSERVARALSHFQKETAEHVLTVLKDDGVYRHLRVGRLGTGMWSWRVVTWPGYLAIVGDVADGYMFSRVTDMLDFFRTGSRDGRDIDFSYWAEKVQGCTREDLREFSEDAFLEAVHKDLFEFNDVTDLSVEADMREEGGTDGEAVADAIKALRERIWSDAREVSDPYGQDRAYYEWLSEYEVEVPEILQDALVLRSPWAPWADDYYEMDATEWDDQFLIACWALALTVSLWDAHVEKEGVRDGFVVVEGGLVQNDPSVPVFDLDVLDSDLPAAEVVGEIVDLHERMAAHPQKDAVDRWIGPVTAFVREHGAPEDVEEMDERLRRRGLAE